MQIKTNGPFSGPLDPFMGGHVVWSDPIYVGDRVQVTPWGTFGDPEWVGTYAPAPRWGGNCLRWWTPLEAGLQPGLPWTYIDPGVALPASGSVTIDLPRGNRWVITAFFCPQEHPNRTEILVVDLVCHADLDGDGGITINDLVLFLEGFEAGNPAAADLSGSEGVPDGGVDVSDLLFFLAAFHGGC